MCVRVCFYLLGTISGKTTVHARTYGPHSDQRPVQIKQNMISEVLTKCKGKVKDSVGFGLACTDACQSQRCSPQWGYYHIKMCSIDLCRAEKCIETGSLCSM